MSMRETCPEIHQSQAVAHLPWRCTNRGSAADPQFTVAVEPPADDFPVAPQRASVLIPADYCRGSHPCKRHGIMFWVA